MLRSWWRQGYLRNYQMKGGSEHIANKESGRNHRTYASSAAVLSSRSFLPASLLASGTWDTKEADWLRDWLRKCLLIRTLLAHFWYVMAPTASGIAGMTKGMLATKA